MEKRRYTKIQELLPIIQAMQEAGKSHKEIEEELGLSGDRPVHNLLKRERRKQERLEKGIMPRPKGRPRKDGQLPHEDEAAELKRLRMENQLLRDFLRFTEGK